MKTENWNKSGQKIITAIGFAYHGGGWYNLGSVLNEQHHSFDDKIPDDEPKIVIARIEQKEVVVEENFKRNPLTTYEQILERKRILLFEIYDQHDNLIYQFPAASMHVSYSPLMGSYKKES